MSSQAQGQLPVPQVVDAHQQPTVYIQAAVLEGSLVRNFPHKASSGFGLCQIIFGIILMLLGTITIFAGIILAVFGTPIWCGAFIIVTGSLGIVASRRKTKQMIIATLTCCIIATVLSGGLVLPMSLTIAVSAGLDGEYIAACVLGAITTLVALAEFVIAIIHSVVCCRAVCCKQQMIPIYYRAQGQQDAPVQPMTTSGGAQRTMFLMPTGVPLTDQSAGYQGPPSDQFQSDNPQGQYPQGQLNISSEQIVYSEQLPSMDLKSSR
ncbi:membrane-spanning 4-domains subfamily A member 4D-like isoform X2 [Ptychodera flava]|uniref:membrane-spanning 4-domains subfamily A member 4D-like isoform X2 n=1 Tax=Ptychodera flava TaxID=63121 RepID=UPI00396A7DF6